MTTSWSFNIDRVARRAGISLVAGVAAIAIIVPVAQHALTPAPRTTIPQRDRVMAEDLLKLMMQEHDIKRPTKVALEPMGAARAAEPPPALRAVSPPPRQAEAPVPVPTPRRATIATPVVAPAATPAARLAVLDEPQPPLSIQPAAEPLPVPARPGLLARTVNVVYRPVARTGEAVYRPVAETTAAATRTVRGAFDGTVQFVKEKVPNPF